jgi:hypothetical protein
MQFRTLSLLAFINVHISYMIRKRIYHVVIIYYGEVNAVNMWWSLAASDHNYFNKNP